MHTRQVKIMSYAVAVLALSACSQEKVCAMGAKAYAQNQVNIAKIQADVDKNPTDANRKLLDKVKANQAKMVEQLKMANCPDIPVTIPAVGSAPSTVQSAPADAGKELGRGTFVAPDGKQMSAVYYANETVVITLTDGTTKTLKQAVSASGIRFVDGEYEWIEHQGDGIYMQGDQTLFEGKIKK